MTMLHPHIAIGRTVSKRSRTEANVAQLLQATAVAVQRFRQKLQLKIFMAALSREPGARVAGGLSRGLGLGRQTNNEGTAFRQWKNNGTFKAFLIGCSARGRKRERAGRDAKGCCCLYSLTTEKPPKQHKPDPAVGPKKQRANRLPWQKPNGQQTFSRPSIPAPFRLFHRTGSL